ncbi:unnamed protein product [Absidia cylindrospora]
MRSSMKRPRAPIACIRCHHKKIRCDGEHPNCARCTQGGILCAYPSSRRSRSSQPTSMNPFIDNLSQLEIKIHQIEANLKTQRRLFLSLNIAHPANNANLAMMTNFTNEAKSKPTEKSTLLEVQPPGISSDQLDHQSQMKPSRKRSSPSSHSRDNDFTLANNSKRRKHSLTKVPTPKIKTSSSPLPLSPSSSSSSLPKTTIPFGNNENSGQSPSSSIPQNYLFPALDPFTCQTDWAQSSSVGGNNDMASHLLYSGQQQQAQQHSLYNVYQQRPLFLPQQISPVTTPDYTDDSSDQFNLATSTPPTSFHYTNGFSKSDNDIHPYPMPPTAYPPHTPSSLPIASSSSIHSLSRIPTSSSCPPALQQQQTTSCQTMDIYNNFAMDDLISFDSQNTGMPLIDNAVWYC